MANYAINGFGRIGRNVLRAMDQEMVEQIVAINDLTDNKTLAHLLRYDSTAGRFDGEVTFDEESISVRGHKIKVFEERDPSKLPWSELGVEVVLESTGFFTAREKAAMHLSAGAKKVLVSAPAKGADCTLVLGVNDAAYDGSQEVVSNASCTTNCLAPMVKVLHDNFGLEKGFMSTIHSYTGDQNLLDAPHSDLRRARNAATNIVPSSTGAAKAIGLVIPELDGKLQGGAFRVPTPTGSVTDFTAILSKAATAKEINAAVKEAASKAPLAGKLLYTEDPIVLADVVGDPHSCVFDAGLTISQGTFVKVVGWYDNEWGYSCRSVEAMKLLAGSL